MKIKEIKIVNQDQSTEIANIGADAINVDYDDTTVKAELDKLNTVDNTLELKLNKKPYYYDNVAAMKADTKLKVGDMAITLGYYTANDGGGAEYRIISENHTDDGGSYHQITNNLYAELIKNNNNVKQYGAYGDGVHDDSTALYNATHDCPNIFVPNGHYICQKQLRLFNTVFVGENMDQTIIEFVNFDTSITQFDQEYNIVNNSFWSTSTIQTVKIENFTFIDNKNYNAAVDSKTIGIANTDGCVFKNLKFINNNNAKSCGIDIYSNNKNCFVENIYVYAKNTTASTGAIKVREYRPYASPSSTIYTDNVSINNLYCELSGFDEAIWIDGWKGKVRNVIISNVRCYSFSSIRSNAVWIAINQSNSILENVILKDSYFYGSEISSRYIDIGSSESTPTNSVVKNVLLSNCIFEIDESTSNSSRIINVGSYLENNGLTIENCRFIGNSSNLIGYGIQSSAFDKAISKNNVFKGRINIALQRVNSFNDYFDNIVNISRTTGYIKGAVGAITGDLFNQYNTTKTQYVAEDCNLTLARVITDSGNVASSATNYNILNSNFNIAEYFMVISSFTNEPIINLKNCNISKIPLSNAKRGIVNVSNLAVNGIEPGIIPNNAIDRYLYNIGTRFISSTSGKTIIKKISAGDATNNWEEL